MTSRLLWNIVLGLALLPPYVARGDLWLSEVMSSNGTTLKDSAGDTPDWIEIWAERGIHLGDFEIRAGKSPWVILPDQKVRAGERLVLFASGRATTEGAKELHVPFKLSAAGETIHLRSRMGAHRHVLKLPALPQDVSVDGREGLPLEEPSPGRRNGATVGWAPDPPTFSHPHGYQSAPVELTLSAEATIYYTTDGSLPDPDTSSVYEHPITITGTSVVRALAYRSGCLPSRVTTATYLFPQDILAPTRKAPPGWPSTPFIAGQKMVYGMEAAANVGATHDELSSGLLNVPSIAVTMDVRDLLGWREGIYTHATGRGRAWERPVSMEWIDPQSPSTGFQMDAGIRIRGGASRRKKAPKHNFRLIARASYGREAFEGPLFEKGMHASCRELGLRSPQNHSWASNGSVDNTFLRDIFARDTQGALGQPHTRGRYVHLFLNGVYWGLYQTHERVNAAFVAAKVGGDPERMDLVEVGRPGILETHTASRAGDLRAWRHLWESVNRLAALPDGEARMEVYQELQGLTLAGARDHALPVYLDVPALIDYMMIILFTGNADAPISHYFNNVHPNNWFAYRLQEGDEGFRFIIHDSEHSLGLPHEASDNRLGPWPGGAAFEDSNPQWIHQQLMAVSAYREAFADRAERLLRRDGGALSASACLRRLETRVRQLEPVIGLQAARWGSARWRHTLGGKTRTKADWYAAVARLREYLQRRPNIFREQLPQSMRFAFGDPEQHLELAPLMSLVAAPSLWEGLVTSGQAWLSVPEGEAYMTTNGMDPRDAGSRMAMMGKCQESVLIGEDSWGRVSLGSVNDAMEEWQDPDFQEDDWPLVRLQEGALGGETETEDPYAIDAERDRLRARVAFVIESLENLVHLEAGLRFEDGYTMWLNGQEIAKETPTRVRVSEERSFQRWISFREHAQWLRKGRNVLAIETQRLRPRASAFLLQPWLAATHVVGGKSFAPPESGEVIKVRSRVGQTWSALTFLSGDSGAERASAENLVISEIMYHPPDVSLAESRMGVKDADAFEFLEFLNIGSKAIDLAKVRFIDGIQFEFPDRGAILEPGKYLVLAKNPRAFAVRYPKVTRVLGPYAGGLKNGGERLTLLDSHSQPIVRFRYEDDGSWPSSADGLGFSLALIDPKGKKNFGKASAWRASAEVHGSPGEGEPSARFAGVVINEILTNSDWPDTDAVEIYNTQPKPVAIGGWYLTDDVKKPHKWRIPPGTVLPAKGFWVALEDDDANPDNNAELGADYFGKAFSLSSLGGEEVYLFSADAKGILTGYSHGVAFDALPTGIAYGRSVNSAGKEVFAIRKPTLGSANGAPLLGPVLFTEVHYHPDDTDPDESTEFVEIWNRTDRAIPLHDPAHPEHVWELKGARFAFPQGVILKGGEVALIVRCEPEAFRREHGLGAEVNVWGPFEGALSNAGERLTLVRPLDPLIDRQGQERVPLVPVDSLRYNDRAPWPEEADGMGRTLERKHLAGVTDEPLSWQASPKEGGTPGRLPVVSPETE